MTKERARRDIHVMVIRAMVNRVGVSAVDIVAVGTAVLVVRVVQAIAAAGRESRAATVEKADVVERAVDAEGAVSAP